MLGKNKLFEIAFYCEKLKQNSAVKESDKLKKKLVDFEEKSKQLTELEEERENL